MANRVIKDSIWDSPSLSVLRPYHQDQWPRWLLQADDWGCFNADPDVIKGLIYPKRKETIKMVLETREIYQNRGLLFTWNEGLRTWGYFVCFDNHNFCNSSGVDNGGKYTKHRRKTPEPPQDLLNQYLTKHSDKFRQVETNSSYPNPNPNPKHTIEFLDYFNLKANKKLTLTEDRKNLIKSRLKDHPIEDLKKAVDNFVADDWEDRHKYCDIIYVIGKQRGKPDNLEKWLNMDKKDTPNKNLAFG